MDIKNLFNQSDVEATYVTAEFANIENLDLENCTINDLTVQNDLTLSGKTASRVLQTDASKKVVTSNTLNNITLTGNTNLSGLTADQLLKLDSSKNIVNDTTDYIDSSELTSALSLYVTITSLATTLLDYVTNSSLATTLTNYVTNSSLATTLLDYVTNSSLASTLSTYLEWADLATPTNNTYSLGGASNRMKNIYASYLELLGTDNTKLLIKDSGGNTKMAVYSESGVVTLNSTLQLNGPFQQDGASAFSTSSGTFTMNSSTVNLASGTASRVLQTDASKNLIYSNTLSSPTLSGTVTTGLTASRALTTNASSQLAVSAVTATELGYVSGVTSALQTQLNGKQATITGGATTITGSNLTASRALVSDGSGKVAVATTTSTEIGYVNGVTSAIQTQLNTKAPTASPTFTGTVTTADNILLSAGASPHPRLMFDSATNSYAYGINQSSAVANTKVNASLGGVKAGIWLGDASNSSQFYIDLAPTNTAGASISRRYNFLHDSFYPQVTNSIQCGLTTNRWSSVNSVLGNFSGTVTTSNLVSTTNNTFDIGTSINEYRLLYVNTAYLSYLNSLSTNIETLKTITPETNNSQALGTTSKRWSNVNSVLGNFSGTLTCSTISSSSTITGNGLASTGGISNSSSGSYAWTSTSDRIIRNSTSPNAGTGLGFDVSGVTQAWITSNGFFQIRSNTAYKSAGSSWTSASDARLKTDIEDFTVSIDVLDQIRPRKFRYINGEDNENCGGCTKHVGIIAQELLPVYPRAISEGENGYYSFDANDLTFILINSVKELKKQNNQLLQRIVDLENRLSNANL